jgi:hypothetical protein
VILDKLKVLKPLLQSSHGIHMTAYIKNRKNLDDLKKQILDSIVKAELNIGEALSPIDRRLFLAPLRLLAADDRLLERIQHNIAVFRTSKIFRVVALPVDIDASCVVATSFHVKPLLRWMRVDKEFLLLGLTNESAQLFLGSQQSIRLVDTLDFSNNDDDVIALIGEWIETHTRLAQPALFVAGEKKLFRTLLKAGAYPRLHKTHIDREFKTENLTALCFDIRSRLETEALLDLDQTVNEFLCVEDYRVAPRNLFQIAKAVARGQVRKLLVADGIKIFGLFNSKTGALIIHPRDLDHKDDDILDDLAQSVLAKGGEVIVTARHEIPDGQVAWALLHSPALEQLKAIDSQLKPNRTIEKERLL